VRMARALRLRHGRDVFDGAALPCEPFRMKVPSRSLFLFAINAGAYSATSSALRDTKAVASEAHRRNNGKPESAGEKIPH
jgi:hypothetical protein